MSSPEAPAPRQDAGGAHPLRAPDPAEVIERPAPVDAAVEGPQPPRPWWFLVARQWPLFVTLCVVTAGLGISAASYWRRGATVAGAGVLLAALLRLLLPEKVAGLLCCRARWFDVAFTAVLGAGIIALAWLVSPTRK